RIAAAGDTTHGASTVTIAEDSRVASVAADSPRPSWRPVSSAEGHLSDAQPAGLLMPAYDMASVSNVSSQADPPLTMLGRPDHAPEFAGSNPVEMDRMPQSPLGSRGAGAPKQTAGFSAETHSSNGRRAQPPASSEVDVLSAAYGDADVDSDQDSSDALSDSGDALLTAEEVADIEKIWGADVGKRSGDWFPFVLDRPDATFDIPTNVEHALVADIDNNGQNELVLTATDGFVYIFRVEPRMKHVVRPAITPLATFNRLPAARRRANATGNGSPYLYMSAPRSPDESDLDLDGTAQPAKPDASARPADHHRSPVPTTPPAAAPAQPVVTASIAASESHTGAESDMSLVSHLLRSIKDASTTQGEAASQSDAASARKVHSSGNLPELQPARTPAARRLSGGRRLSLTSRMREGFASIVSGSDTPRRPSSTFNRTAPPSLSHSRVHTANNSGSSTNAHSRRPSLGDASEIGQANADSDSRPFSLKAPSVAQATPVVVTSDSRLGPSRTRARNNTICIGGLDSGDLPDVASGNLPSIVECSPSAPMSRQSATHTSSLQADGTVVRDFELDAPDRGETVASRLARATGSRAHSRRNSLSRSMASRAHSRCSSISSAVARPRIPPNPGDIPADSRRESLGSNPSVDESSTNNDSTASQTALPVPATVSARGSFSKPQLRPRLADASEDNASLISQVTERLEDLSFKTKGKLAVQQPSIAPAARHDAALLESIAATVQLPPARNVVDWSATTADKVATWFLDNIPGSVSMINVPIGTFGEPLTSRRRIIYTDDSSEYSCSSCSCSLCGGSNNNSDSEESAPSRSRMDRVVGVQPVQAAKGRGSSQPDIHAGLSTANAAADAGGLKHGAIARSMGVHSMGTAAYSGLNLPQPLGLGAIYKDGPEARESADPTDDADDASSESSDAVSPLITPPATDRTGARPQQFLLLSKPGGRFVPIDMVKGAILPTVDPPEVQQSIFTGGNTAHMMNVDASGSMHSYPMSLDPSVLHSSNIDLTATTGSYLCQSPSWQSGSIPWVQHPPSFQSAGVLAKSPAPLTDEPRPSGDHGASGAYVPRPYDEMPARAGGSPSSSQAESAATHPDDPRRHAGSYASMFKPGSASGAASLSNLRSRRSLQRTSYEYLRGQPASRNGPAYRGSTRSGSMTPAPPASSGQYDRRQLGYAGLRGYIGGANSRQRGNSRDEMYSGYYTPLASSRGLSTGISQGLSSGTMPREPAPGYFSSVSTNASALNGGRLNPRSFRNLHAPPLSATSPQRPAQLRYSPSIAAGWASYRDNALTTIQDQEDIPEGEEHGETIRRPSSATPATGSSSAGNLEPSELPATTQPAGLVPRAATASPFAERTFWMSTEPASGRSHSSVGTGGSANPAADDEKEEEIEEAPAPMEFDVATYLVGGVTPGRRLRRVLPGPCGSGAIDDAAEAAISEGEARELVSMVTMDGTISCYDPARQVSHFVGLGLKDPVLGIWKAKMHDEVSNPSPLEAMCREGCVPLGSSVGERLLRSTPAKRIYRRVGLSHRGLLNAVQYSAHVEDTVHLVNRLESQRRRRALSAARGRQPQHQHRQISYGTSSERPGVEPFRRRQSPQRVLRSNTLTKTNRFGLVGRLREGLRHSRPGSIVRPRGRNSITQPSEASVPPDASQGAAEDGPSHDAATPGQSFSPLAARKLSAAERQALNLDTARECGDDEPGGAWADPAQLQRALSSDIATALGGWYGRNRHDYRRDLHVSDHLIVSTWRGSTYFVDVSTLMDIAHYSELFMHCWNNNTAAAAESALASDGAVTERSGTLSTIYGHLSDFSDVSGLVSRLRPNASVVQFKFQDTVSAFLADTYAPATGGPNVPCLFYVDYKDRIWAYYHLDEVAEVDDVYGATWLRDEPERLHTPESRRRAEESGLDFINYDKPFSAVDLAYRRINLDPWMPLDEDDELFQGLLTRSQVDYPYSVKTWRKPARVQTTADVAEGMVRQESGEEDLPKRNSQAESSHTPSEASAMYAQQVTANVTGRYHSSYLPGPYLCPIWSDINSVDLYDVGVCNLLELAMPELLAMKHVFCQALGISPRSVDEKTNLAAIPGMANWVRSCLYFS
ncbi:hypothetical protein H4S02_000452, partial [Coemansia sp. RSA 2611]